MSERLNSRGTLAEILAEFDAPSDVSEKIIRRAGGVFGIHGGLTYYRVREVIVDNMNRGQPNWPTILEELGEATNRIYKGKRPF